MFLRITLETVLSSLRILGDLLGDFARPTWEPSLPSDSGPSVTARDAVRCKCSSPLSWPLDLRMGRLLCSSGGRHSLSGECLLSVSTVGRWGRQFSIFRAFSRSFSLLLPCSSCFSVKGKAFPARRTRSARSLSCCGARSTSIGSSSSSLSSDKGNGSSPARVASSGWFKPPMKLMRTASPCEAWGFRRFRPLGMGERSELSDVG